MVRRITSTTATPLNAAIRWRAERWFRLVMPRISTAACWTPSNQDLGLTAAAGCKESVILQSPRKFRGCQSDGSGPALLPYLKVQWRSFEVAASGADRPLATVSGTIGLGQRGMEQASGQRDHRYAHRPKERLPRGDQGLGVCGARLICFARARKRAYSRTRLEYFRQRSTLYRANAGTFCWQLRLRALGDVLTVAWTLVSHSAERAAVAVWFGGAGIVPLRMARRSTRTATPRRRAASGKPRLEVSLMGLDPGWGGPSDHRTVLKARVCCRSAEHDLRVSLDPSYPCGLLPGPTSLRGRPPRLPFSREAAALATLRLCPPAAPSRAAIQRLDPSTPSSRAGT